jgi:hypothetical protein
MPLTFRRFEQEDTFYQHVSLDAFRHFNGQSIF